MWMSASGLLTGFKSAMFLRVKGKGGDDVHVWWVNGGERDDDIVWLKKRWSSATVRKRKGWRGEMRLGWAEQSFCSKTHSLSTNVEGAASPDRMPKVSDQFEIHLKRSELLRGRHGGDVLRCLEMS